MEERNKDLKLKAQKAALDAEHERLKVQRLKNQRDRGTKLEES